MKKKNVLFAGTLLLGLALLQTNGFAQQQKEEELKQKQEQQEQAKTESELKKLKAEQELKEQMFWTQSKDKELKYGVYTTPKEIFETFNLPSAPNFVYAGLSDKNFNLSMNKTFKGETLTKKSNFTVDKENSKIRFNATGRCSEGSIVIKILLPNGKTFYTFQVDPTANVSWSQSLSIEKDEGKYQGEWGIEIDAKKVTGMYTLAISIY